MGLLMTSFHGVIEVLVMGEQAAGVDRNFIGTVWPRAFMELLYPHLWTKLLPTCVRQTSNRSDWSPVLYGFTLQYSFSNRQLVPFAWFRGSDTSKNKAKQKTFNLPAMKYTADLNKWDLLERPCFLQAFSQQRHDCLGRSPKIAAGVWCSI